MSRRGSVTSLACFVVATSWSSAAYSQPRRGVKTPVAKRTIQPVVMTPKASTVAAPRAEEPANRPRRGSMPPDKRSDARAKIAKQLGVPVGSLATPIVASSVRRTKDPTGLDAGMAIKLGVAKWKVSFGTGGSARFHGWSPKAVAGDHFWCTNNCGFWIDLTLPTTAPTTPQAYALECPVSTHRTLPAVLALRVTWKRPSGAPTDIEASTPVVTTDKTHGWVYAPVVLPPGASRDVTISLNLANGDIVFDECELSRLY